MELPRRKLLIILTCPLPLILYLLCLSIAYHFVVPNHETDNKDHVETTAEDIKNEQNATERYYQNDTESGIFNSVANNSMRTEHFNITKSVKNQNQSRHQNTSSFLRQSTEMNDEYENHNQ